MSDQRSYKTSPAQGWASMKDILDREMPVVENNRKRGWWFWLPILTASLFVVTTAGTMYLKSSGSSFFKSNDVNTSSTPPALSNPSHNANQNPAATFDEAEIKSNEQIEISNTATSTSSGTSSNATAISNTNTSEVKVNSIIEKSAKKEFTPGNPSKAESKQSISSKKSKENKALDPLAPAMRKLKSKREPMAMIDPIKADNVIDGTSTLENTANQIGEISNNQEAGTGEAVVASDLLFENNSTVDPLLLQTNFDIDYEGGLDDADMLALPLAQSTVVGPVRKNKFRVSPYAFGNGLLATSQGAGLQAGLGTSLSITPWLNGVMQLGYQSMNPQAAVFEDKMDFSYENNTIVESLDPDGFNNIIVGDNLNSSTSINNLFPLLSRVEQWQAKVGLQANIGKRFSIESGYGYGFQTQVRTDYPIYPDLASSPSQDIKATNDLNSYNVVRENMHLVYAGIGFRAFRFVEVFGRFDYAFNNYLKLEPALNNSDRRDNLSGLQLGIRIYPLAAKSWKS